MERVSWPGAVDEILRGDLTAALSYVTPAGGAVVTAVAPLGLTSPETGTVTFTTSLAFGKKLERLKKNPRVALAYHARKHGFSAAPQYVLVQGDASFSLEPSASYMEEVVFPAATRHLGAPKEGLLWDRWLREYYRDRIPLDVAVRRVVVWNDLGCRGEPEVHGEPLPGKPPAAQTPPKNGSAPRIDSEHAAARLSKLPFLLAGFPGADGYPMVVPVGIRGSGPSGIRLDAEPGLLPAGGRRAGLLGHDYHPQLIGLRTRLQTGWLEDGLYSPHTDFGFAAPPNKRLLLLINGGMAKYALRKARRAGLTHAG